MEETQTPLKNDLQKELATKQDIFEIQKYPNSILRKKCIETDTADPEIIAKAKKTMLAMQGLGLAAPQIGIAQRFFVMQHSTGNILTLINPIITEKSDELINDAEGCLSFPGILINVERPFSVTVSFFDENGEEKLENFVGLDARIVLHEIDHLDGVLFVDHISQMKKSIVLNKLKKHTFGKQGYCVIN